MSLLDVYCLLHFEDKQYYTTMVEIGLTLDCIDFIRYGYHVDEEKYPMSTSMASSRKEKATASSS